MRWMQDDNRDYGMTNEYTDQEKHDFEIAVRKLEGKCIDCNTQLAMYEDRCGFCLAKIRRAEFKSMDDSDPRKDTLFGSQPYEVRYAMNEQAAVEGLAIIRAKQDNQST